MQANDVKNVSDLVNVMCFHFYLYLGSSQGLQAIIGGIIIVIALIASYIINMDRSGDQWSFRKSTVEHYQA